MAHWGDPFFVTLLLVVLLMLALSGYAILMEVLKWLRS